MGPLRRFFLPCMKLVAKWREGSRWVRRHDAGQTAYQRLLAHGDLPTKTRRALRDRHESLHPVVLAQEVERRLKPLAETSNSWQSLRMECSFFIASIRSYRSRTVRRERPMFL